MSFILAHMFLDEFFLLYLCSEPSSRLGKMFGGNDQCTNKRYVNCISNISRKNYFFLLWLWSVNKNDELFHNYNFSATTVQINDQVEQSEQISNNDYSILKDSKVCNILIFSLISLIALISFDCMSECLSKYIFLYRENTFLTEMESFSDIHLTS